MQPPAQSCCWACLEGMFYALHSGNWQLGCSAGRGDAKCHRCQPRLSLHGLGSPHLLSITSPSVVMIDAFLEAGCLSKSCCQLLTSTCLGVSCACFRAGPSKATNVSADAFQKNSWDTVQSGTEVAAVLAVPNMKSSSKVPQCHTHSVMKTIATRS